jgi:hypothetical protein
MRRRRRASSGAVLLVIAGLVVLFVVVRLGTHHWKPGAFVVAGSVFVHPGAPAELPVTPHSTGYDGTFYYRLALDPLTRRATAYGITLDDPPYRQQRIALPALAWALHHATGMSTAVALIAVDGVATVGLGGIGISWARRFGRSPWWGVALAASPPVVIGLARDLGEPLALAALLGGLLLWVNAHRAGAALAFSVAGLARETALVVALGMGVWWAARLLFTRRRREAAVRVAWLLVPGLVELAWQLYLGHVWGHLPALHGATAVGALPLVSVIDSFGHGVSAIGFSHAGLLDLLWLLERVALAGLLLVVAGGLASTELPWDLLCGWVLAAVMAVSVHWLADVQFVRAAAEAILVGQLALLARRDLFADVTRGGVVLWSAAVSLAYAVAL